MKSYLKNGYSQRTDNIPTSSNTFVSKLKKVYLHPLDLTWIVIMKFTGFIKEQLLGIYLYSKEYIRYWRMIRQFKGRTPLPIIGNFALKGLIDWPYAQDKALEFVNELRLGQFWISYKRHIFVSTPEDIEAVLSNNKNNLKGVMYDKVQSEGLLTISGQKWKIHRRIIQPSFHVQVLDTYVELFSRYGIELVQQLASKANGEFFNIAEHLHKINFLIIMEGLIDSPVMPENVSELIEELYTLLDCFGKRIIYPWLYPTFLYRLSSYGRKEMKARKVVDRFIKEAIENKRRELEKTPSYSNDTVQSERRSFLTHIVAEHMQGAPITEDEVIEEILHIFLGSMEPPDSALQSALYYLGHNRHVQEKMMEELRGVFHDDSTVTVEKLNKLSYTEMVLKETLRLAPPIWLGTRRAGEDTPLQCGLTIPQGAEVLVVIKTLHMDPKIYPNPEVFDPERFSEERKNNYGPYDYIPFMKGPRNCIGYQYAMMQIKSMLAQLVWHYEIYPDPTYEPVFEWALVTIILNGTSLALRPRRKDM